MIVIPAARTRYASLVSLMRNDAINRAQPGLSSQVALVTGASRGVGRGVAVALAAAGMRVYATGRAIADAGLADSRITVLRCDHADDKSVEAVFAQIHAQHPALDVLVNCAWGGYERMVEDGRFTWPAPFWDQPAWRWEAMMTVGVRAAFVASQHAARKMVLARRGLIANISSWAARTYIGNVLYGVSKVAIDKMTADMAHELRPHGVTVVSLYPGLVRTEAVLAAGVFDLSNSESPEFIGRTVAALAADPNIAIRSGQVLIAADLAREYGFTDVDGRQPTPLTIADVTRT
jgi:NAD(P)-dependent dehydrogenase (short-subunit alcohol dehydrogenase family)